jgi:hypothetical protein
MPQRSLSSPLLPFVPSLNETMFLIPQVWARASGRVRPFGEHKPNAFCSTKLKMLDDKLATANRLFHALVLLSFELGLRNLYQLALNQLNLVYTCRK